MDHTKPNYYQILKQFNFNVPRRHPTISQLYAKSGYDRKSYELTWEEEDRWIALKKFSDWFDDPTTCYFDTLDALIILSEGELDKPNTPIALIHPTVSHQGGSKTTVTLENGDHTIITRWQNDQMTKHYRNKYPTATYWAALRKNDHQPLGWLK